MNQLKANTNVAFVAYGKRIAPTHYRLMSLAVLVIVDDLVDSAFRDRLARQEKEAMLAGKITMVGLLVGVFAPCRPVRSRLC
jgi:hypothetical protein